MIPLAHSARHGCPEQTYHDHVANVLRDAVGYAEAAARFSRTRSTDFLGAVEMAAAYHDLGKLDPLFQDDLRENHLKTRINHVDAGAAHLLSENQKQGEAACLVCSHHRPGLRDLERERGKNANGIIGMFRDWELNEATGSTVREHVDIHLSSYLAEHHRWIPVASKKSRPGFTGLTRRLALSCLVDADHGDTARHYGKECDVEGAPLRAGERLKALDAYVEELGKTSAGSEREMERLSLRQRLYAACRNRELAPDENLVACESPVGTGKTTAVMAHLLNVAALRGLRRIFVVLPFTNIIDQSVKVYRDALVLPGGKCGGNRSGSSSSSGVRWRGGT
jgi:CRISPR-associated endonuclease/helicase Cas3